jgi:hypothetical protein
MINTKKLNRPERLAVARFGLMSNFAILTANTIEIKKTNSL